MGTIIDGSNLPWQNVDLFSEINFHGEIFKVYKRLRPRCLSNTSNELYKHNDVQKVNQIKFVVDGISITAFCYQISIVMDV